MVSDLLWLLRARSVGFFDPWQNLTQQLTFLSSILYGYDGTFLPRLLVIDDINKLNFASSFFSQGTYFTGVVAMREWLEHFGDEVDADGNAAISSSQLSLLSSIVQVGEFVGALSAGFIGGRFGRRGGLVAASICVSVGGSHHCLQLLSGCPAHSQVFQAALFKWLLKVTETTGWEAEWCSDWVLVSFPVGDPDCVFA